MNTPYDQVVVRIIEEQALIIGPLAWSEAEKVHGIKVIDRDRGVVSVEGDAPKLVDSLIEQYERLFGRASHEVCRHATADIVAHMNPAEVPLSLR